MLTVSYKNNYSSHESCSMLTEQLFNIEMMFDVFLSVQQYIYLRMWSENVSIMFSFSTKTEKRRPLWKVTLAE